MLVITGESGAGKTTIESIMSGLGYKPIISYTSRPIRKYEQDGVHYHFLSPEEFQQHKANGFFAESTTYNRWHYGMAREDCKEDSLAVCEIFGLEQLQWQGYNPIVIYIKTSEENRRIRLMLRGDHLSEIARRISSDKELFAGVKEKADFTFSNDEDGLDGLPKRVEEFVNTYLRK